MSADASMQEDRSAGSVSTRERVLRAAVEVFAERGYHQATVRAICKKAGANVASVNYHFKGKDELYLEAVHRLYEQTELPGQHHRDASMPPAQRLRGYIRAHLQTLAGAGEGGGLFAAIMTKEMTDPSPVFSQLLDSCLKPRGRVLEQLLDELSDGRLPPFVLQACTLSVLGQCIIYLKARKVIPLVYPDYLEAPDLEDKLTEHIAEFSEAGLKSAMERAGS